MLAEHGVETLVVERDSSPGGLAASERWGGFRFHFGVHPFSTHNALLEGLLKGLLGDEILAQYPKRSLWYRGAFLGTGTAQIGMLKKFGPELFALGWAGYFLSHRLQGRSPQSLAEWSNLTVGPWIHDALIDPLVRKVWGLSSVALAAPERSVFWPRPPSLVSAFSTVLGAILPNRWGVEVNDICYVPKKGWGHLADVMTERLESKGGQVVCSTSVRGLHMDNGRFAGLMLADGSSLEADAVVLTNPLPEWASWLSPIDTVSPASGLHYRHLLMVGLSLKRPVPAMAYHTVDVGDPALPAVSFHSPNAWSPNPATSPELLLESYVAAHEPLWLAPDQEVVRQLLDGCAALGLLNPDDVAEYRVARIPNAAPVHSQGYANIRLGALTMAESIPNLALCGRGLFLHQGPDGGMESGFRAALSTLQALGQRPASFGDPVLTDS